MNEVIGAILKAHLQPIHQQLESVESALSSAQSPRVKRPRTSSGIDSDADDEDEDNITDSKFLSRPVSHSKDKKFDAMRAAVRDALIDHSVMINASRSNFGLDDVRAVVEEALHNQGKALVHVPVPEILEQHHSRRMSELQSRHDETLARSVEEATQRRAVEEREADTRKLLRLTEEELHLLRATVFDKDHQIHARERECDDLRERLEAVKDSEHQLATQVGDFEAETTALAATLAEYRTSSDKWRHDLDHAEVEKDNLHATISELKGQLADGLNVRDNMRAKLDKIQTDMAAAAEQLASQKTSWSSRSEELQKRHAVMHSRLDAEMQLRAGLDNEIQRLRTQVSEGTAAKMSLEQAFKSNALLEEAIQEMKYELSEQQTINSRIVREIQDARENSRFEVQRAELMMQVGIETANSQAEAMRAGLESKLAIATNELDNMRTLVQATQLRHEVLLQEEADLRRHTLLKVNEASSAALESLRARHDEDILYVNVQRDRAIAEAQQDKQRAETFWQDRLGLSEARSGHLQERIIHLEERLTVAKSAAQAAVSAAQAAKFIPVATPSKATERISPQALRESILVLQEQLQERETRIERLQVQAASVDNELPEKLRQRDIEISWLRELLSNRGDEISGLIENLQRPDFDRETVRDAAIRISANLQMEQSEKERLIGAGSSITGQAIAGLTNFASPRAVQLAAAIGNWRSKGVEAMASNNRHSPMSARLAESAQTPSKRPPSAASFLTGLMTPPASNLRRTPSPHSPSTVTPGSSMSRSRSTQSNPLTAGSRSRPMSAKTVVSAMRDVSPATPLATPLSLRRQSYDADAELGAVDARMVNDDDDRDDDEVVIASPVPIVDARPMLHRSLASELEPLG